MITLIKTAYYDSGLTWKATYDKNNNQTSYKESNGSWVTFKYDERR
jgi:uncharacterized protein RhaS with RHS repeats